MTNKYFGALLVCFLIVLSAFDTIAQKLWLEKDGIAVIEAESAPNLPKSSGWVKGDTLQGYYGSGYMVWRGTGDWGPESRPYDSITQETRILTYHVEIQKAGIYYLKLRNQHQHEDGDNDVWTSVNGSDWGKTYDWQENEWSLDERGIWAKYTLEKGINKVELAGRSQGFSVDRIFLYQIDIPVESLRGDVRTSKTKKK